MLYPFWPWLSDAPNFTFKYKYFPHSWRASYKNVFILDNVNALHRMSAVVANAGKMNSKVCECLFLQRYLFSLLRWCRFVSFPFSLLLEDGIAFDFSYFCKKIMSLELYHVWLVFIHYASYYHQCFPFSLTKVFYVLQYDIRYGTLFYKWI